MEPTSGPAPRSPDKAPASGECGRGPDPGQRLAAQERRLRLLLTHLAGRAVRARVEVDDLLQEVYLRALAAPEHMPAWEGGAEPDGGHDDVPLRRYLSHLARHAVIDAARAIRALKRTGRVERLQRSDWSRTSAGPASPGAGPATQAASAETGRRLARRFLELDPEHRRVIGLRQFEGLSARESARRMGRSEVAVHSLYRRALAAWQLALEADPGFSDESAAPLRPGPA